MAAASTQAADEWIAGGPAAVQAWLDGAPPNSWLQQGVSLAGDWAKNAIDGVTSTTLTVLSQGLEEVQKGLSVEWLERLEQLCGEHVPGHVIELPADVMETINLAEQWNSKAMSLLAEVIEKVDRSKRLMQKMIGAIKNVKERTLQIGRGVFLEEDMQKLLTLFRKIETHHQDVEKQLNITLQVTAATRKALSNNVNPILESTRFAAIKIQELLQAGDIQEAFSEANKLRQKIKDSNMDQTLKQLIASLPQDIQELIVEAKDVGWTTQKGDQTEHTIHIAQEKILEEVGVKLLAFVQVILDRLQKTEAAVLAFATIELSPLPMLPSDVVAVGKVLLSTRDAVVDSLDPEGSAALNALARTGLSLRRTRGSLFAGRAYAKMEKWRLPGDDIFIEEFRVRRNFRPFLLIPAFIPMVFLEDVTGYVTHAKNSDGEPVLDRNINQLSPMLKNGTLQCAFGNAQQHNPLQDLVQCPAVYQFHGSLWTPFVWAIALGVIIAWCSYRARKIEREKGQTCVGKYFHIYMGGFANSHLYGWVIFLALIFLYSLLSRVLVVNSKHECMAWGDWEGHASTCLRLCAIEPHTLPLLAYTLLLVWITALYQCAEPKNKRTIPKAASLELDRVTAAAVNIKGLVRRQWVDANNKSESIIYLGTLPKQLFSLLVSVFSSQLEELDEVLDDFADDFAGDFAESFQNIANNLALDDFELMSEKAKQLYENEIAGVLDQGLVKAAEKRMVNTVAVAKKRAGELVEVKMEDLMGKVQKARRPQSAITLCAANGLTVFGFVYGVVCALSLLIFANQRSNSYFGGAIPTLNKYACVLNGDDYSCLPAPDAEDESNPWPYVRYKFQSKLGMAGTQEVKLLIESLSPLVAVCIVLKVIACGFAGGLLFVTVNQAKTGLESAAQPMTILGSMLNSWVLEERVTTTQLNAWWDARRSLLHNEVAMMMDRYENVLAGYIFVSFIIVGYETFRVCFLKEEPDLILVQICITAVICTWICLQAGLKCNAAQKRHIMLFQSLKRVLTGDVPEQKRVLKAISNTVDFIQENDYQTKVLFLPLDRKLIGGVASYVGTAVVSIVLSLLGR